MGVYGGVFDPVHIGHLRVALELQQALALSEVRFIPVGDPPHRAAPHAPAQLRVTMLRTAIAGQDGFAVDERELARAGRSYTVDTLAELHEEFPQRDLALIMGMDAFRKFTRWHRWESILDIADLVVANRPGSTLPDTGPEAELLAERQRPARGPGRIIVQTVTALNIASSEIRKLRAQDQDIRYLVPDVVRQLILQNDCYRESLINQ